MNLSERIRPGVEAAPWVIEEVKKLEQELASAYLDNLMPTLLEAVELLETLRYSMSQYDDGEWFLHEGSDELIANVDDFMEKLK